MNILYAVLAGVMAGAVGGMGLGGGSVLLIYLTVFAGIPQLRAQGINLIFFLPCGITALAVYTKRGVIRWKKVLPVVAMGVLGTLTGSYLAGILNSRWLGILFGLCLIGYGLFEVFRPGHKQDEEDKERKQKA